MEVNEKYNLLDLFERENKVTNYSFVGIPIWPILKQSIILELEKDWKRVPSNSFKSILKKINLKIFVFLKFFILNFFSLFFSFIYTLLLITGIKKINVLYLSGTNAKRVKKNNKYYDVFCDPIIDELSVNNKLNNYLVLETSNEYNYKKKSYHKSMNIQLLIHFSHFLSLIFTRLNTFKKNKDIEILINKLEVFFKKKEVNYSTKSYSSLIFEVYNIYFLGIIFNQIIKKAKVKIVFMICYYGPQGMAMCNAANKNNIHSIDIQHGVQGENHYGYAQWNSINKKISNVFPKEFWVWSDKEKELINSWGSFVNISAITTGNLFLEKSLKDKKRENISLPTSINKETKIILFTLDEIPTIPAIVIKNLKAINVFWLFRFHPRTTLNDKKKIKYFLKDYDNTNIELANDNNLYDLLKIIDWHITELSSVVIEASIFGIPSIILSNLGANYYKDYIEQGKAFFCNKDEELKIKLDNHYQNMANNSNNFYKFDVLKYTNQILKY